MGAGHTLMHIAAYNGSAKIAPKWLWSLYDALAAGQALAFGSLNSYNQKGRTALHIAAAHGNTPCMEALMLHGADPNLPTLASRLPEQPALGRNGLAPLAGVTALDLVQQSGILQNTARRLEVHRFERVYNMNSSQEVEPGWQGFRASSRGPWPGVAARFAASPAFQQASGDAAAA